MTDGELWPNKCPRCGRPSDETCYWFNVEPYESANESRPHGICWDCDYPHPVLARTASAETPPDLPEGWSDHEAKLRLELLYVLNENETYGKTTVSIGPEQTHLWQETAGTVCIETDVLVALVRRAGLLP